jgi:nitroimidazol reductase NimA-like FMN-containing flavoprotein (pyridoxamine 5'-phosphate oxidase superfamily)
VTDPTSERRRGVKMTTQEAWDFVARAHTGILTSLRRDGRPIALPVWFVAHDRRIFVSTRGKKVDRLAHDQRCSFLVEAGERWAELQAVHLACMARVVGDDEPIRAVVTEAMAQKYAAYRTPATSMPSATRRHYASSSALLELIPDERFISWDNRLLQMGT